VFSRALIARTEHVAYDFRPRAERGKTESVGGHVEIYDLKKFNVTCMVARCLSCLRLAEVLESLGSSRSFRKLQDANEHWK
jgi:hypothetical protein